MSKVNFSVNDPCSYEHYLKTGPAYKKKKESSENFESHSGRRAHNCEDHYNEIVSIHSSNT